MTKAYENIGGFLSARDPEHLVQKTDFIKAYRYGGEIVAAIGYKLQRGGRKAIYVGTNGTEVGKKWLYRILIDDIEQVERKAFSEVSGAMEHINIKHGAIPIPAKLVADIIDREIELIPNDEYHYYRVIAGEKHKKMLVGNILL